MSFFLIAAALSIIAVLMLTAPLWLPQRTRPDETELGAAIYADQLKALDTEVEQGRLAPQEAEEARAEIGRRLLAAKKEIASAEERDVAPSPLMAVLVAVAVPVVAGGVYMALGAPGERDRPFAARSDIEVEAAPAPAMAQDDGEHPDTVVQMVENLAARLKEEPDNAEGWAMLARSYTVMNRREDARAAFERVFELVGRTDPRLLAEYGETLVNLQDGLVSELAKQAFRDAVELEPNSPPGRYYLALARYQAGEVEAALTDLSTLIKDLGPSHPATEAIRQAAVQIAGNVDLEPRDYGIPMEPIIAEAPPPMAGGGDGSEPRGPTAEDIANAQQMSDDDQQEMIRTMVTGLRERLDDNPADADGWLRLARAYDVLGEGEDKIYALRRATEARPGDPQILSVYADALIDAAPQGEVPPEALSALTQALEADPANQAALWFLGREAAITGDAETARKHWGALLAQLPEGSEDARIVSEAIKTLDGG